MDQNSSPWQDSDQLALAALATSTLAAAKGEPGRSRK